MAGIVKKKGGGTRVKTSKESLRDGKKGAKALIRRIKKR